MLCNCLFENARKFTIYYLLGRGETLNFYFVFLFCYFEFLSSFYVIFIKWSIFMGRTELI